MGDTTIKKIDSSHSPIGQDGQIFLASGNALAMRLWKDEPVSKDVHESERDYETVGYVIQGRAELHSEGQSISLGPGDSWLVPKGAKHHYQIVEPFTAIEATSPPAEVHGKDTAEQVTITETPKTVDQSREHANQQSDDNKTEANSQEHEEKARHDQEVAAQIPRNSKNITSNAPEKERKPSEHVDVKEKEKSK